MRVKNITPFYVGKELHKKATVYGYYHCGNKELIRTLLKKKYYALFRESLTQVTDETKALVKKTLETIDDKRLQKQKEELLVLLNK